MAGTLRRRFQASHRAEPSEEDLSAEVWERELRRSRKPWRRRRPSSWPLRCSERAEGSNSSDSSLSPPQRLRDEQAYRAVRAGEYYASGFIADRRALPSGTLVGPVERSAIRRLTTRSSAALYSAVVVTPPQGQAFRPGDMLLAYEVDLQLRGYGDLVA